MCRHGGPGGGLMGHSAWHATGGAWWPSNGYVDWRCHGPADDHSRAGGCAGCSAGCRSRGVRPADGRVRSLCGIWGAGPGLGGRPADRDRAPRRGTRRRPASGVDNSGCGHRCQGPGCAAAATAGGAGFRYADDRNETQIADMPRRSADTVTGQISRGLARLREATAGPGEPEPGRMKGAHHR